MSLDVHLTAKNPITVVGTGVFVREDGKNRELTLEEVKEKWPNAEVEERADETNEVYSANITHNLGKMADEAGVYYALWRPEEKGWKLAKDIIEPLEQGLKNLEDNPDRFKQFNPENGWGSYEGLVEFVKNYLTACKEYPEAEIYASR